MTIEEFETKRKELRKKFEAEEILLAKEYAVANNPHQKGDIIESYQGRLLIEDFTVIKYSLGLPEIEFIGVRLKKDNTPVKSGEKIYAYLSNRPVKIKSKND